MSEEICCGQFPIKSTVPADYTNALHPNKNYDTAKVDFDMPVAPIPDSDKIAVQYERQWYVTTWDVLYEYLPYFNDNYENCLAFIHKVLRDAYGYPYEQREGKQIHHVAPVNGLLDLFYCDRVKMPMTKEGGFCQKLREFFELDNRYMNGEGNLIPVDIDTHNELTEVQKQRPYQADLWKNVQMRWNPEVPYPNNPYYRFGRGSSIVNRHMTYGNPRFSVETFYCECL